MASSSSDAASNRRSPQMRSGGGMKSPEANAIVAEQPWGEEGDASVTYRSSQAGVASSLSDTQNHGEEYAPQEALKLTAKVRALEEEQNVRSSILAALQLELKQAQSNVKELELAHKSGHKEMENVMRRFSKEREFFSSQEEDRVRETAQSLGDAIEREKKARRRLESLNRKLSGKVTETNMAMEKILQELEKERKARALMEDVCDELAKEIGKDKAEMEVLRREHAKAREEAEEERKMLRMAEVWHEERVQTKLVDAKHDLEDRASIIDWLRMKLEEFIQTRSPPSTARFNDNAADSLLDAIGSHHLRKGSEVEAEEEADNSFSQSQAESWMGKAMNNQHVVWNDEPFFTTRDGRQKDSWNDDSSDEWVTERNGRDIECEEEAGTQLEMADDLAMWSLNLDAKISTSAQRHYNNIQQGSTSASDHPGLNTLKDTIGWSKTRREEKQRNLPNNKKRSSCS